MSEKSTHHDDHIITSDTSDHAQSPFVSFEVDADFKLEVSETLVQGFTKIGFNLFIGC